VRHYQGQLACHAVSAVIQCLIRTGRLPAGYTEPSAHAGLFSARSTTPLFGRARELREVLAGVEERRCAIVVGAPGEGKSALLDAAARQLQTDLSNAHVVHASFAGMRQYDMHVHMCQHMVVK
jgi:ABC-type transporter Mla maintaining outer membrane lipid asymmetry ATPase subunit MlaF